VQPSKNNARCDSKSFGRRAGAAEPSKVGAASRYIDPAQGCNAAADVIWRLQSLRQKEEA
jgi:hypothetical protein